MKLNIGATFPTAQDVRNIKSKSQKRLEELQLATEKFIREDLRKLIIEAQENDCKGSSYKETAWFEYPTFLKEYKEREQFVSMLKETLEPLGYSVRGETDSAMEPTKNVVVSWKEQAPKPRKVNPEYP